MDKLTEAINMVIVNGQKSSILKIIKNVQLKIMDALVLINIHIVDLIKEELLIESNWFFKYKADQYKKDKNIEIISIASDSDNESTLTLSKKAINWLHQAAYFKKYNRNPDEAVWKWLKIENKEQIDEEVQIKNNLIE